MEIQGLQIKYYTRESINYNGHLWGDGFSDPDGNGLARGPNALEGEDYLFRGGCYCGGVLMVSCLEDPAKQIHIKTRTVTGRFCDSFSTVMVLVQFVAEVLEHRDYGES